MKIEVNAINKITFGRNLSTTPALQLNIDSTDYQQEHIVCKIWEELGDEAFLAIVEREGYTITKKVESQDLTREVMGDFYTSLPAFRKK